MFWSRYRDTEREWQFVDIFELWWYFIICIYARMLSIDPYNLTLSKTKEEEEKEQ